MLCQVIRHRALDSQYSSLAALPFGKDALVSEVGQTMDVFGNLLPSSTSVIVPLRRPTCISLSRNSSWALVENRTLFLVFSIIAPLILLGLFL